MKTSHKILIALTCIFAAFILGLFLGRNYNRQPIQIQQLPAPTKAVAAPIPSETAPTEPPIININTATVAQLQTLPGIGPIIAERIVAYRNENGAFETVGDLIGVEGIGEKKLEEIWDHVTIGG